MKISRRQFNRLAAGSLLIPGTAPSLSFAGDRPTLPTGIASGDVSSDGAVIWARADRPARLWVTVSPTPDFKQTVKFRGTAALQDNDFNAHAVTQGLPAGSDWFYRAQFESLESHGRFGESLSGTFSTAPTTAAESIRFCWSGDTAGQGWGIDPAHGGMKTYATMLSHKPDFFVHNGDQIYADDTMQETRTLDDGSEWKNLLVEAKTRVAQTTQEFRENFYYNYLDEHVRRFHAAVPTFYQWDDHEVYNNWYPGRLLEDDRYSEKSASLLASRARRAMFECNPIRLNAGDPERLYRAANYGPLLDLFFLDLRSYRGPNSRNIQTERSPETAFMGDAQLEWLKAALKSSRATWKIVCTDLSLGILVREWGTEISENGANGDGPPLGREFEIADLLSFIKTEKISNVHFITTDVHYCASNHYHPDRAEFKDFAPFWEFVSGPLHAGSFAPGPLDNTFGPERVFTGVPEDLAPNRPPSEGYQFFGQIDIDAGSGAMTVSHYNREDKLLWTKTFAK